MSLHSVVGFCIFPCLVWLFHLLAGARYFIFCRFFYCLFWLWLRLSRLPALLPVYPLSVWRSPYSFFIFSSLLCLSSVLRACAVWSALFLLFCVSLASLCRSAFGCVMLSLFLVSAWLCHFPSSLDVPVPTSFRSGLACFHVILWQSCFRVSLCVFASDFASDWLCLAVALYLMSCLRSSPFVPVSLRCTIHPIRLFLCMYISATCRCIGRLLVVVRSSNGGVFLYKQIYLSLCGFVISGGRRCGLNTRN